jgi:membrane-bound ClpP family serine protease
MWIVAGVLLGVVVLASLAGLHAGPHAHLAAGVVAVVAAAWFLVMAADGHSAPVVWALLGADLMVGTGVAFTAWKGLTVQGLTGHHLTSLESAEGVAVSDLAPQGIVRVRGEQWSAASVNGTVRTGTKVQVLRAEGVRLEVWGEDAEPAATGGGLFHLDGSDRGELTR